jgi:hypothetical protein
VNGRTAAWAGSGLALPAALTAAALLVGWAVVTAAALGSGRILAGTRIGGQRVGLMRPEAAARRLDPAPDPTTLRLDLGPAGGAERRLMPADVGLVRDPRASAEAALAWSRSRRGRASSLAFGLAPASDRPWRYRLDEGRARAFLLTLAAELERPPDPPTLQAAGGRIAVLAGQPGLRLDLEGSVAELGRVEVIADDGSLVVRPVWSDIPPAEPAIHPTDLARLERRLGTAAAVDGFDPIRDETATWRVGVADWPALLPRAILADGAWRWQPDRGAVAAWAAEATVGLGPERYLDDDDVTHAMLELASGADRADLRIRHRPGEHVVEAGESLSSIGQAHGLPYPWIKAANPDLGQVLSPGQRLRLPSLDSLLPLPPERDRRIVVTLSTQRLAAWEGGVQRWDWTVSTGIAESPTAAGVFQVQDRQREAYASAWDLWMPHFLAIYKPDPTRPIFNGFHGIPWHPNGERVWADLVGRPASYGCIVLQDASAAALYEWAVPGTVVEVRP